MLSWREFFRSTGTGRTESAPALRLTEINHACAAGAACDKTRYVSSNRANRLSDPMSTALIEALGFCAATLTTLCWLPQAWHTIRTRDTSGISLWTQALFATGIVLWLIYGALIASWPLIGANTVTLVLVLVILTMKLRYG
jgi:MtN3 and saliva related transmembrane protein